MSTEQTAVLDKAAKTAEAGFVLTKSGVMFIGSELLGEKLAAIMCEAIVRDDLHGLACLTIRDDNFPIEGDDPVFGMAFADTNSVAINLQHCWHRACVKASKGDVNLSFMGILWVNLLDTLAHELDHLAIANNDRELYELMRSTEEGQKDLEDSAKAAGEPLMLDLAKKFDIEPPSAGDFGWFGIKLMELFTEESTRDLEWVIQARKDMEAGIMYAEPKNNVKIDTFREFVKIGYDNNGEGWDQATTCVNLTAHLETGEVETFKAEPVEAPVLETVALEEEVEAPIVMVAGAETGQFVNAGVDLENGEPDVVMADTAAQAVVDAPAAALLCPNTSCGKELKAEWNSCPHCKTVVNKEGLAVVQAAIAAGHPIPCEATASEEVAALEVPLPAPVVAQAAAIAGAATTGVPPAQEVPTTYTLVNSMSDEAMRGCMESIWKILYHHTFTKCGWQQNPQTGRFMFANAAAVLEGVNVQHILTQFGADNFIMEYDTLDADGKYAAEMCQGMIRGRTTSKQGLPSYTLYLNIGGTRIKRTFIPQNPEKKNAQNAYTNSAENAAAGHCIVWVFKDEVADAAPFNEKCAATIKDNVYEVMS